MDARTGGVAGALGPLAANVGKEKRPLSWMIGEQGVIRPAIQPMKERKREERMGMVDFRPADEI